MGAIINDKNPLVLSLADVRQMQRTKAGLAYENYITKIRDLLDGKSPEAQKKALALNGDLVKGLENPRYRADGTELKAITPGAVHVDRLLSNISIMYKNDDYIGETLMPAVAVTNRSDKYSKYPKRERFSFPDDRIGHRSSPNELDESRDTDNYSVDDFGYKNFLDLETVRNQDAPLNEMVDLVEAINEGLAFRREKRILPIVTTVGSFGTNHADAATAWDDATDLGGTIIPDVLGARAALWQGSTPTRIVGYTTLAVWNTAIANNAKIRELFKYTGQGLAITTQVAGFFGLDDIFITQAREDTANIGQTASYARMVTGDVFGIVRVAARPTLRSLHFGSTFRCPPFTSEWTDPAVGVRGGIWARASVSETHKVVAPDAGFLITDCLS